jgi:glycosyltransferase involved in cell wall biosynthesis
VKIVFTVYTYYPQKDGVQAVTQYIAEGLAAKGHNVTVVTQKVPEREDIAEHNGVKIKVFDVYTSHAIHRGNKQEYRRQILNLCEDADVLVNVANQIVCTDWLFRILDDIKCKKVLYSHGIINFNLGKDDFSSFKKFASKLWRNSRWGIYYITAYKNFRKYDLITYLYGFEHAAVYSRKHKLTNDMVLGNAADNIFFEKDTCQLLNGNYSKKYLINVSSFQRIKNQELLLKAFYKSRCKDYALILIGSSETAYYKKLIHAKEQLDILYGRREVDFKIGLSREQIRNYVANAKLFLASSTIDVFPVVIAETMAVGVPFVSTDVGCVRFLPGGVIIKNEDEMAYWIDQLISHPEVAKKLGEVGRCYAEKEMRIENKINEFEKLLLNILK